ncbi:MAG: sigma-70 family RNA polymerase sigma factor [Planctomycetota bacterium]|nr:sigma-70 family RNA polymerase sigma factor [Planctomycetota bacterium]
MKVATYPQNSLVREAQAFIDRVGAQSPAHPDPAVDPGDAGGLDTALMQIFTATGDVRAYEYLYQLTSEPLLGWIRGRARQIARRLDVREILQDTFINIYRYAKSFKGEGIHGFRRWARTIAANAMHRASRKRTLVFSEWSEGVMQVSAGVGTPQNLAEAQEFALELESAYQLLLRVTPLAFAKLSARDRFVLNAVDVHGSLYREVEKELGLRSGALKMIVHRARIRFRSHLKTALAC